MKESYFWSTSIHTLVHDGKVQKYDMINYK